jgi:hypothetical protein
VLLAIRSEIDARLAINRDIDPPQESLCDPQATLLFSDEAFRRGTEGDLESSSGRIDASFISGTHALAIVRPASASVWDCLTC